MNKFEKYTLVGVVGFWLLVFLGAAVVWGAEKHPDLKSPYHWWDYACCNEKDCRPAEEGEVEETKEGYRFTFPDGTKTLIRWNDTRLKKKPVDNPYAYDGYHHVCIDLNEDEGWWYLRCFYPALGAY